MNSALDESCSSMVYDHALAKRVHDVLDKKYPGHLWATNVNQGVIFVKNLALSGNYGFILKQEDLDNGYRAIIKAGGEILERFNVSRGRLKDDEMLNLNRDFALRPVGDKS